MIAQAPRHHRFGDWSDVIESGCCQHIFFELQRSVILGEAVKRLSPEFRLQHPEIPWSSVAGMRDRLIPDYDEIDLEQV